MVKNTQSHQRHSVYAEGRAEALKFKWIESQKAQRDLGEDALKEWVRQHWGKLVRARWIEHLEGRRFFAEFHADQFGFLQQPCPVDQALLKRVIDQLRDNLENLNLYTWACDGQINCDELHRLLDLLRVNDTHLPPPFALAVVAA